MVSLTALWLPILLSAVLVFVASSIIHMALPWHSRDWKKLSSEDALLDALRPFKLAPGDYMAPLAGSMAEMNTSEFKEKVNRGPRIAMTVLGPGNTMPQNLAKWFVYGIIVAVFAGYVASTTLGAGAPYLMVFRVTSTVAFLSYALALWQGWIWYSRSLGYTLRSTIDGLVYGLLTGGVFGWLWP
jgi:hypothetical protein